MKIIYAVVLLFLLLGPVMGWGKTISPGSDNLNTSSRPLISNTTDFFRSNVATTGNWTDVASWESSPDNSTWSAATLVPTSAAQTITIRTGHTIIVNSSISLDETVIDGTLELQTGSVLNINDGIGSDINISSGGIINIKNTTGSYAAIIPATTASINIETSGKIAILGNGTTVSTNMHIFATNASNVWNDGAIFEWNCSGATPIITNLTYFPNATASTSPPIFRIISVTNPVNGGNPFVLNGMLDLLTNVSFGSGGDKTFRDGISGTSATVTFSNGTTTISSYTAVLSGTLTLILNQTLNLSNGVKIPTGSTVIIDRTGTPLNIAKNAGIFNVEANAIFDIGYSSMSNTLVSGGSLNISGTFRTGNTKGFTGTGSSLPSSPATINLNAGCTIELNRNDGTDQTLATRADFKNLTFSGSGTKSLLTNGFNPAGTVLIKDAAIFDAANNTFGDATTSLTMTGGRFRLSGASLKPDMEGVYNLTGGVIEFYNSAGGNQTINGEYGAGIPIEYNQIEVTGSNVANSNTNITLKSGGTFLIKNGGFFEINADAIIGPSGTQSVIVENGGTFKCGDIDGFSNGTGATATSVHQNIETINLQTGSTVEYIRAGDQKITNLFNGSSNLIYQNIIFKGSGNKTAPLSTLEIKGNLYGLGTASFVHNNGTVLMSAIIAQNYTAANPFNFYNLTNSNTEATTGLSIDGNLTLVNALTLSANSKLKLTSGNITLKSDINRTAYVDQVAAGATVTYSTGKFIIERYIPAKRSWRLLTSPVIAASGETISDSWREAATPVWPMAANATTNAFNPYPGYGTHISGGTSLNNYDQNTTGNASIKYFDPSVAPGGAWKNLSTSINLASKKVTDERGYMLFVRGSRALNLANGTAVAADITTLRTRGQINLSNSTPYSLNLAGLQVVGNPFASAINFNTLATNNLMTQADNKFYLWDPYLAGTNGVGAWVTLASRGNGTYDRTVTALNDYSGMGGNQGIDDIGTIQSGAAFIMDFGTGKTINFSENIKISGSSNLVFRPTRQVRTNLYIVNAGNQTAVVDGVLNTFGSTYSNAVDGLDVNKLSNFSENLSIRRDKKKIAIERRAMVKETDTIFYHLAQMKQKTYLLEFSPDSMEENNLAAFLEDQYLNSITPVSLADTTRVVFSVDSKPQSAMQDRFRLVFRPSTKYNSIAACVKGEDVAVNWEVAQELNIKEYQVERSVDGISFARLCIIAAKENENKEVAYNWLDQRPAPGTYYYRIHTISNNGVKSFSETAKARLVRTNAEIYVFPNPVTDQQIKLQLNKAVQGIYRVKILNAGGQELRKQNLSHVGGSATHTITPSQRLISGTYELEVLGPDKKKTVLKILVQ